MKYLVLALSFSFLTYADNATKLLLNTEGDDIDVSSKLKRTKELKLNDPYLVTLFGKWKTAGALDPKINEWMNQLFYHEFDAALASYAMVYELAPAKFKQPLAVTKLYLLNRLGMSSSFISAWLETVASGQLLKSELGMSLDIVVGEKLTNTLLADGHYLSPAELSQLKSIEDQSSRINAILQSFAALRDGKDALKWITQLSADSPLRLKLARTALIDYAREGQLKASAKLIKEVVEPQIEKSSDTDEISYYYLTLARLLYQARAFDESRQYYQRIPTSSQYYLQASTEMLWAKLQNSDLSSVKGMMATLKLELFEDKFFPEIYLVSSIANLRTCQFLQVQKNFNNFVANNRKWAREIQKNLDAADPQLIGEDFFTQNIQRYQASMQKDLNWLKDHPRSVWIKLSSTLKSKLAGADTALRLEKRRRWVNREKLLSEAIYKMRFVKIEFISQMRDFSMELAKGYEDSVSTYAAATAQNNQLRFKADGVVWSDELFNGTAQVENLCLKGKQL